MGFLTNWIAKKASARNEMSDISKRAAKTFPTEAHTHAAQELYGMLSEGQGHGMNNAQWRWTGAPHPWDLKPNAFHDMVEISEDMPDDYKNALYSNYYTMKNLPGALNNQKNIDILIEAANKDDSPY